VNDQKIDTIWWKAEEHKYTDTNEKPEEDESDEIMK